MLGDYNLFLTKRDFFFARTLIFDSLFVRFSFVLTYRDEKCACLLPPVSFSSAAEQNAGRNCSYVAVNGS